MPTLLLTADEVVDRGEAIYEQTLRSQVETGNIGRYIAIDIATGQYEIGDEHLPTVKLLRARLPQDALVCTLRVGYPAVAVIGGRLRPNSIPS